MNNVSVLSAFCGFGKSTHMIYYIKELHPLYQIFVSYPRRLSAVYIALRMRYLYGDRYKIVHAVQFDDNSIHPAVDIAYITEGLLLQKVIHIHHFTRNKIIVLDEAHEMSANMVLLLQLLRQYIRSYQASKLLVCSATANVSALCNYLNCNNCVILRRPLYHVEVIFMNKHIDINGIAYINDIYEVLLEHILEVGYAYRSVIVFLPGIHEIRYLARMLQKLNYSAMDRHPYDVQILHSMFCHEGWLSNAARVIYLATNIAETSLTLPDVNLVIDSGIHKKMVYSKQLQRYELVNQYISINNMIYRQGRCGRTCNGKYIGIFDRSRLTQEPHYEIYNMDLHGFVMQYLDHYHNFSKLDLIVPMNYQALLRAVEKLYSNGCLDRYGKIRRFGAFYNYVLFLDDINHAKLIYIAQKCDTSTLVQTIRVVSFLAAIRRNSGVYVNLNTRKIPTNGDNDFIVLHALCAIIDGYGDDTAAASAALSIDCHTLWLYRMIRDRILAIVQNRTIKAMAAFPIRLFETIYSKENYLERRGNAYYSTTLGYYVTISKYSYVRPEKAKRLYYDGTFTGSNGQVAAIYVMVGHE